MIQGGDFVKVSASDVSSAARLAFLLQLYGYKIIQGSTHCVSKLWEQHTHTYYTAALDVLHQYLHFLHRLREYDVPWNTVLIISLAYYPSLIMVKSQAKTQIFSLVKMAVRIIVKLTALY